MPPGSISPASGEPGLCGNVEPGEPLVLLYSDDLDVTVAAVKDAGGTIAEEPYAFPGGRRFTFFDPRGNRLGVWSTT